MTTDNMFFRLPSGTKARINLLAREHEPLSNVIIRALAALEATTLDAMSDSAGYSQIADSDSAVDSAGYSQIADRLAAIEARLTALESTNNSQVVAPVKSRSQSVLTPLQSTSFNNDAECWRWAYEQHVAGYSLKDINAALPERLRKKNPSRDFKKEWDNFDIDERRGGGGGGDELQTELTVKSHCE